MLIKANKVENRMKSDWILIILSIIVGIVLTLIVVFSGIELNRRYKEKDCIKNKTEVGEYGRTNYGEIIKFAWLENSEGETVKNKVILINGNEISNDFYYFYKGEKIVKHSKQLTDLIENKDVVKVRIDKEIMFFGMDEDTSDIKYKELIENIENGEYELLEILTHEKFEANCYKVGGE